MRRLARTALAAVISGGAAGGAACGAASTTADSPSDAGAIDASLPDAATEPGPDGGRDASADAVADADDDRDAGSPASDGATVFDAGPGSGKVLIAFIGDSITAGTGASTFASDWVSLVSDRLGPSAVVGNFGVSGTTMMKVSDAPYWDTNGLSRATAFLAGAGASDVAAVVIMLGTNDAKDDPNGIDNWNGTAPQRYHDDYVSMIELLQAARTPAPRVLLALPPTAYADSYGIDPAVVARQIVPIVRALAADAGLPLIDVFDATADAGSDFPQDGIHPDDDGEVLIAAVMYAGLTQVVAPDAGWPDSAAP